jgi:hypothetical protein
MRWIDLCVDSQPLQKTFHQQVSAGLAAKASQQHWAENGIAEPC